jgi:hypothetical protein
LEVGNHVLRGSIVTGDGWAPLPDGRRSRYGLVTQQCALGPAKVRVGLTTSNLQRSTFIRAI